MSARGCTQCGNCLDVCPVFSLTRREEMSPKAKHALLEALAARRGNQDSEEYRGLDPRALALLAEYCVSCGRCRLECSRALSVPDTLAAARAAQPGWRQWFWKNWILSGASAWPAAAALSRLLPPFGKDGGFIRENIRSAKAMHAPKPPAPLLRCTPAATGNNEPVALFAGCTAVRIRQSWSAAAAALLAAKGYAPVPDTLFTCCGGTLAHAGIPEAALAAAKKNAAVWRSMGYPKLAVFCASCHHALARYRAMPGVFADAEEISRWEGALTPLARLFAASDFAPVNCAPAGSILDGKVPASLRYHSPCHWEKNDPDRALLQCILPGLSQDSEPGSGPGPVSDKDRCCGLGGVVKLANPGLSMDIARACWEGLAKGERHTRVLTGCGGCVMQLAASAPKGCAAYHWLDMVTADPRERPEDPPLSLSAGATSGSP